MVLVFNATFNNISVISWQRKPDFPEKNTDLLTNYTCGMVTEENFCWENICYKNF